MGRDIITFELRKRKDADIKRALDASCEPSERSDLIRGILRAYFYPGNTSTLLTTLKPQTPTVAGLGFEDITLEHVEKSAEDLDGALDNLLSDF